MTISWKQLRGEAPDLAAAVERSLAQGKHKVMATLRRDGSPRVSGTEIELIDGDLWIGSMPGAMKAGDLRRDPRVAVHGPTTDETMALGDVKVAGRATEVTDETTKAWFVGRYAEHAGHEPPQPFHLFRIEVDEVVRTRVEGDHLIVESWHEGRGVARAER